MSVGSVSHVGLIDEVAHIPFNITGSVTSADVGKPVTIDATADRAVKLAGDDDVIVGQLVTYEDRTIEGVKVATVAMRGGMKFVPASGNSIAKGGSIIGAGGGEVKEAAAAVPGNIVTFISATSVEVLFV